MLLNVITRKLSKEQMAVVDTGLNSGLTKRQILIYAKPEFSPRQMEELRLSILADIPKHELRVMADPRVSADDMRRIRNIYMLSTSIQNDMACLSKDINSLTIK